MTQISDEQVEALLTRVGRGLVPARGRLVSALRRSVQNASKRSPLSLISLYMSTVTKTALALAAVIVVGGGAYFLMTPGGSREVALDQGSNEPVATTDVVGSPATGSLAVAEPAPASFDDVAAAFAAETAAETAGLAAFDAAVAAEVSGTGSFTSTADFAAYDNF